MRAFENITNLLLRVFKITEKIDKIEEKLTKKPN